MKQQTDFKTHELTKIQYLVTAMIIMWQNWYSA